MQLYVAVYLVRYLQSKLTSTERSDRGDVAEKIVIVGIFVALAIAVGALITNAVTGDANNISRTISSANN